MEDASFSSRNNSLSDYTTTTTSTTPTTTTKPKLSLLSSSKQFVTNRVKSQDDQLDQKITSISLNNDDYLNSNSQGDSTSRPDLLESSTTNQPNTTSKFSADAINHRTKEPHSNAHITNNAQQSDQENKMNITKEDLFRLLSMLKSELQSKEFALAAIKCEQLKRLINPIEISRSSLANTYIELQDRFKLYDQNNNKKTIKLNEPPAPSSASTLSNQNIPHQASECTDSQILENNENEENERESLKILNTLLELLDRHPLLALPRDSIYCLDYNCNEVSTKNYLNLKIQHLDNLISQHKNYRFFMNERLKRSEQRYLELTRELELERKLKFENDKTVYKVSGKSVLLRHIDQLKEALEKEKKDKQTIVTALLNEMLDEREHNEALTKKLMENEKVLAEKLTQKNVLNEKEKLRMMETEVNNLSTQLNKQLMVFVKEKNELQTKVSELETENGNLKSKLEQQEKRTSNFLSKSTSAATTPDQSSESVHVVSSTNKSAHVIQKLTTSPNKQFSSAPAVVTRTSIGPSASTRSVVLNKTTNSSTTHNSRTMNNTTASNGSTSLNPSRQGPPNSSHLQTSTTNASKSSASPQTSRLLGGNSSTVDNTSVRVQPLLKSASLSSNSSQVKTPKPTFGSGSAALNRASSVTSSNHSPSSTNKPQVPAKPAQLLDQQRNAQ